MTTQPTHAQLAEALARQVVEAMAGLPNEDYARVVERVKTGGGGEMLRAMLVATRGLGGEQGLAFALQSNGEHWSETADLLDRLAASADPTDRDELNRRSLVLRETARSFADSAARMLARIDAEAEKHA